MSNKVSIIYYDSENPICSEQMQKWADGVRSIIGGKVLIVPDNMTILENCSIEQLLIIKSQIDEIVENKVGYTSYISQ